MCWVKGVELLLAYNSESAQVQDNRGRCPVDMVKDGLENSAKLKGMLAT